MKRMMRVARILATVLTCMACCTAGAEGFSIQSFNGNGQLVFNSLNSATNYRIEWASSPAGPWTNFTFGAGAFLDNIPAVQGGSITCSVPVFYRVVASVTNAWLFLETAGDLAFGDVRVGDTPTLMLTLRNRGGAALTVSGIDCPDGFSCNWSGVIPAGYEQDVPVTFMPTENAFYGGTLTVHSDAAGGVFVMVVSGRGLSDYLVIDLSGGTDASRYPVTYLNNVPIDGWNDTYKTTELVMRLIRKGTFTMGSPDSELGRYNSETRHTVTLTKNFYMGVFEVTQRQWELVMGNKPSGFNNASYYASRPVEMVSYYDIRENPASNSHDPAVDWPNNSAVNAASFMGKLRAKTGLSTFDLPTEAQWEYACRAGTTTALNTGYNLTSTSSDPRMDAAGRYLYNGGFIGGTISPSSNCTTDNGTAKVGSYLPNAWGLYDMHGNLWERCLDWGLGYEGSQRVIRGGCWVYGASISRSASGSASTPYSQYNGVGFRAASTLP